MSNEIFRIKGEMKTMVVYENKVMLEGEKGLIAAASGVTQGQKSFGYESITSLEFKEATLLDNGHLAFNLQGDAGRSSVVGFGKAMMGFQNDNTFKFQKRSQNVEVQNIKNYIEDQMLKSKQTTQSLVNAVSPADELRKYKQLMDDGIITQEEFNEKKKQLL